MELLHDGQGHQAVKHKLQIVCEQIYWRPVLQDVRNWVKKCCQTAEGPYIDPNASLGSIIAKISMDLLCIDFMKVELRKDGKENVLVMTDAFSKFSVVVVMPNQ